MFLTTIIFIALLSILILVHELGHFLAAKRAGIRVEEFGFGYPPRIWGKKIKGTIYSINWIPFGGFVRMLGEELKEVEAVPKTKKQASFWAKSPKARLMVIVAGVFANLVLATVCFSAVYTALGIPTDLGAVEVLEVMDDSPAQEMGLQVGDRIERFNGQEVTELETFVRWVDESRGEMASFEVVREGERLTLEAAIREEVPEQEGPLGVLVSDTEVKKYPVWQMPFRGVVYGMKEAFAWTKLILRGVGQMLGGLIFRGEAPKDVAGPVGIFQMTGQVAQYGFWSVIQFMGILSINLMVVNILPFPALDGGRLAFLLYEAITKRRPKPSIEHWVNAGGMIALISLLLLTTVNDILRLINPSVLWDGLRSFLGVR